MATKRKAKPTLSVKFKYKPWDGRRLRGARKWSPAKFSVELEAAGYSPVSIAREITTLTDRETTVAEVEDWLGAGDADFDSAMAVAYTLRCGIVRLTDAA